MGRYSSTRINSRTVRFYDRAASRIVQVQEAMSPEQKAYTALNNAFSSNNTTVSVVDPAVTFVAISFATVPAGFPAVQKDDFTVYVNGIAETLTVNTGANNGDWFSDTSSAARDNIAIGVRKDDTPDLFFNS